MSNFAGEVQIRGWDKRFGARAGLSQLADRGSRSSPGTAGLSVSSSGTPGAVDYDISVPAWMPVKIEGTYIYIAVEGTQADVSAETVRGDIVIKGGATFVTAKSVEGEVILEGVRGRVNASSINQGVTVNGAAGELSAETVNGHIALNNIDATSVEVASVNGNIKYDGSAAAERQIPVLDPQREHLGRGAGKRERRVHACGPTTAASGLTCNSRAEARSGAASATTYTLGSGSAEFELESFGGTIQLRRRGSEGPLKPRQRQGASRAQADSPEPAVRRRADPRPGRPHGFRDVLVGPRSRVPGNQPPQRIALLQFEPAAAPRTAFLAGAGRPSSFLAHKDADLSKTVRETSTRVLGRTPSSVRPGDAGVRR